MKKEIIWYLLEELFGFAALVLIVLGMIIVAKDYCGGEIGVKLIIVGMFNELLYFVLQEYNEGD